MKLVTKIFARIWHDLFYILFPGKLSVWIALNCKDAVTEINTLQKGSFRMQLHLTLCSACRNYFRYSVWLKDTLKNDTPDLQNLNGKLLRKISSKDQGAL